MIVTIDSGSMRPDSIKKMMKIQSDTVPELANRKKTVLLFFAKNGKANIYRIEKECKIRYSTAHSSIKSLEKEGLVQLKSKEINKKGVPATIYGLTTKGLHRAIFELPIWQEKIAVAEKWQRLLNPNVVEWMKFIEALNDPRTEEMVNSQIGGFLNCSDDLGFFVDAIDDLYFDALLATMIDFDDSYKIVMEKIASFPRILKRLPKLIKEDMAWREEDLKRYRRIKEELEKLY